MVIKIRMVITTGEKGLVSGGELKGVSRALVILYTLTLVKKLHRFFSLCKISSSHTLIFAYFSLCMFYFNKKVCSF